MTDQMPVHGGAGQGFGFPPEFLGIILAQLMGSRLHQREDHLELTVSGRLDGYWAQHLQTSVGEIMREGTHSLRLNLAETSYISSAGIGSASHLAAELFKSMAGIEMVHVPNKGMSPALVDLMGAQVQAMFASVPALLTEQSDRVRPIAMAERKRSALMPMLPTISESGLPGFEVGNWAGLLGPAGLDPSIVKKLHAEIIGILDTPDMKDRIKKLGYDVLASPPDEFGMQIRNDVVRWSEVVKKADIPLN